VRAVQCKTRLGCLGDVECGASANQERLMTILQVVSYGGLKLSVMSLLVAVGAGREFHLVDRVLARG